MRLAIAFLAFAVLAGCSIKYDLSGADWTKPGAGLEEATYDEMECVRSARDAGHTPDLVVGGLADVGRYAVDEHQRGGAYRSCMQARGYRPSGS